MTQIQRLDFLIESLLKEQTQYKDINCPVTVADRKQLLRSLLNVRPPKPVDDTFLQIQDDYLKEELQSIGITGPADLQSISEGIFLWRGDITTLKADAERN